MVASGDQVEWFSASFPGALSDEDLDGIRIMRSGTQWSVHWKAFQRYRGRLSGNFDVVIDEINTMPFFTPLWAGIPTVALIFQLAREVWWYESRFPVSVAGFLAERVYLRPYRKIHAVTISSSTESDLRSLGFRGDIDVVPIGIEPCLTSRNWKSPDPTFLYVGRLAPSKRLDHVIRALAIFRSSVGAGKLQIVGVGAPVYIRYLQRLVRALGLRESVIFQGHVSKSEKHRLMSEAHAILMASVREGWGLVVTEANSCGTPAIVYDVPGLRDAVRHEQTGLVVDANPRAMAEGMLKLHNSPSLVAELIAEARLWSLGFSFDHSAVAIRRAINHAVDAASMLARAACR
jgi:glycosyltransferase involved in cell wall biosynthesis